MRDGEPVPTPEKPEVTVDGEVVEIDEDGNVMVEYEEGQSFDKVVVKFEEEVTLTNVKTTGGTANVNLVGSEKDIIANLKDSGITLKKDGNIITITSSKAITADHITKYGNKITVIFDKAEFTINLAVK